ncbi:GNAT family N-acetyltransferase [Hydrogenophaga sp. 5NK40-0174]|uniref:GNAT family N-acetyltransferase n=1 Tax=Hydrogenophaga sp. 5NK40-0174 TaxID=3127649 RepID=UPI00310A0FFB
MNQPGAVVRLLPIGEASLADIARLHNDPQVRTHLPLATMAFDEALALAWRNEKARLWSEHGYGPWVVELNGAFAGWGGPQPENGEADLALVLLPEAWGHGLAICKAVLKRAFDELKLPSMTALLPPSRVRQRGMQRMGFVPDGEFVIDGQRFVRYRMFAQAA